MSGTAVSGPVTETESDRECFRPVTDDRLREAKELACRLAAKSFHEGHLVRDLVVEILRMRGGS